MSFKSEMLVAGEWCSNAVRFATSAEAEAYGCDMFMRWTQPTDKRVMPSQDPVTAVWIDGKMEWK